jgi:hypothetical protein
MSKFSGSITARTKPMRIGSTKFYRRLQEGG